MANDRQGRGGEDVNSIFNSCFFIYFSLLGDFCTENTIKKKRMVKY